MLKGLPFKERRLVYSRHAGGQGLIHISLRLAVTTVAWRTQASFGKSFKTCTFIIAKFSLNWSIVEVLNYFDPIWIAIG